MSSDTDPNYAIDGKFANVFHSGDEKFYPWLQVHLSETVVVETVTIVNRIAGPDQFDAGSLLENIEIRAGSEALVSNVIDPIAINHLCGHVTGPGESGGIYTVQCRNFVQSDYVTVQAISQNHSILQITEILVNEFKSTTKLGRHYSILKIKY